MCASSKTPFVLLITDVGRDVDDLDAIRVLCGLHKQRKCNFFAMVMSGGGTRELLEQRAQVAYQELKRCGLQGDVQISVAASGFVGSEATGRCISVPDDGDFDPRQIRDATELLLTAAETHGTSLELQVIGPATPLSFALKDSACARAFTASPPSHVAFQGQVQEADGRCVPDPISFNFREDMDAARHVLDFFQDLPCELTFSGKHLAYALPIRRAELEEVQKLSGTDVDLVREALETLNVFRSGSPAVFATIYSLPLDIASVPEQDTSWYPHMTEKLGMPYDPTLSLIRWYPDLFDKTIAKMMTVATIIQVGHAKETPGVVSAEEIARVKQEMYQLMTIGLGRFEDPL